MLRPLLVLLLCGSGQRKLILAAPWNQENDAAIRLKMRDGMIADAYSRNYNVRSADQAQRIATAPCAAGVHQLASLDLEAFAGQRIGAVHPPKTVRRSLPGVGPYVVGSPCAIRHSVQDVFDHESCRRNAAIVKD